MKLIKGCTVFAQVEHDCLYVLVLYFVRCVSVYVRDILRHFVCICVIFVRLNSGVRTF